MELIKITETDGKRAVSARELQIFLELETDLTRWVTRMSEYGFVENVDWTKLATENQQVDYALTIETAKHWSMMQRTEKGMQARNYFIECEKQLKSIPDFNNPAIAARAWADEYEKRQLAESKVKEMKPKADVYDSISNADNLTDIGKAAKSLGIGRTTLFSLLRGDKILMANNTPYQKFIDSGYFEVKVKEIKKGDYIDAYSQTFVTGKGLTWLSGKYRNKQND